MIKMKKISLIVIFTIVQIFNKIIIFKIRVKPKIKFRINKFKILVL
jgi:hypothetical protein